MEISNKDENPVTSVQWLSSENTVEANDDQLENSPEVLAESLIPTSQGKHALILL